ncbi:MAG: hypothetical protein OXI96_11115 [Acidimicrobiaceae bacterium]|nr:hypothetical protein [Acidimicrobiaceae bacterium]
MTIAKHSTDRLDIPPPTPQRGFKRRQCHSHARPTGLVVTVGGS